MNAVSLRRNRLLAGVFAAMIAITGIAAGAAEPAAADRAPAAYSKKIDYVALGDSYAAGQGGGRYLDACLHTKASYPRSLDRIRNVKLIADLTCSGDSTADVLYEQIPHAANKIRKAELVTITAGANDLLTEEILSTCQQPVPTAATVGQPDACTALVVAAITVVKANMIKALAKIHSIKRWAKVVVTGYPRLYEPTTDVLANRINAGMDLLNTALYSAVETARYWGVRAEFVDVTQGFAGHAVGSADPWIHAEGPDRLHPTKHGHKAYAALVRAAL